MSVREKKVFMSVGVSTRNKEVLMSVNMSACEEKVLMNLIVSKGRDRSIAIVQRCGVNDGSC
jgi:hypothetical protein